MSEERIILPKETEKLLNKVLKHNPDFEDVEFIVYYCARRYYD